MFSLWFSVALAGPSTLIVGVTDVQDAAGLLAPHASGEVDCYDAARVCWFDSADPERANKALSASPRVRYVERDAPMDLVPTVAPSRERRSALPSDASGTADCSDQWELDAIGMSTVWASVTGEDAPVVAIADGGFLQSHEEITGKVSGQWDYGNGDSYAELEQDVGVPAHGTFIGAMIGAYGDNGVGRAGIAPDVQLNLLKIADSYGSFYWSYAISALADIGEGDLGIRVVNYSIASSSDNSGFRDAVEALADADILMAAAAANCTSAHCWDADNDSYPLYPANYSFDHVITVAGSTVDDELNPYSHYGADSVDIAAPGVDLCSAGVLADDDYYTSSGTSYATPIVAAAAALLWERHIDLTATDVGRMLRASADEVGGLEEVTQSGRLDVAGALRTAVPRMSEPSDLTVDVSDAFTLVLRNVGYEGTAHVLWLHDNAVRVEGASDGFTAENFAAGDRVELPDKGEWLATVGGTLVTGAVDEHQTLTLELDVLGREVGTHDTTVRVAMSSVGADYLNAPYDEGSSDKSGFLAYSVEVEVLEADTGPAQTDTDPPDTESGDTDSEAVSDTDTEGSSEQDDPEEKKDCGCAAGGLSGVWLGLLPLWLRRRR